MKEGNGWSVQQERLSDGPEAEEGAPFRSVFRRSLITETHAQDCSEGFLRRGSYQAILSEVHVLSVQPQYRLTIAYVGERLWGMDLGVEGVDWSRSRC